MPSIIAVLWGAFYSMIGTMVGRVLFSLGMGYVTYSGFDYMLDKIKNQIIDNFTGAGPVVLGILYHAKVDVCISIIFSAILIKYTLSGFNKANGSFTRMVHK